MLALAAVCTLAACDLPDDQPQLEAPQAIAAPPRTELADRLDTPELAVDGAPLNGKLLKRFYARHDWMPVWATRPAQTRSLIAAVLRAGDQGLSPSLFHAGALQRAGSLPPLDRELLLSDAFLSYADALARGAVPVERRGDNQVLTPGPVDVAEALDRATNRDNPGAAIESLAPRTPAYLGLRQALRVYGSPAFARRRETVARLRTITVNLERQRWLPRVLPPERVAVNVADQSMAFFRAGRPVFVTRVVVGESPRNLQTPEFRATIDASFFDPPWVIPADIVSAEILPKIAQDPNYLTKNHMVLLDGGQAEQLPGPDAGLGLLMFDMPNRFDVFLHDTPDRYIFNYPNRRLSHGCIRVQNPRVLAALLLQDPLAVIDAGIAKNETTRHPLPRPVPVFVTYQTAFIDAGGRLQIRPDFYGRDGEIWEKLQHRGDPDATVEDAGDHPAPETLPAS